MKKYLWRFNFGCGRMGSLKGLFVATEKEVEDAIGQEAYFGEVLGKHSEIYGTIERDEIVKVELDSKTVEKVSKILGDTWSGYNPLHYVEEATGKECPACETNCCDDEWDCVTGMCYDCSEKEANDEN